ncbi:hypothetical protein Fuma_02305 [Fuerstiella marisgermanici]|uniref:Uncharacterized protein n=1 Tax=Fuerstiella marisgermanici TaxID=1891926 RepID=A0A1P8WF75_9PLAN|nr:hypothetical protein Fuma_02305 [Fuerstiella marisgermanici]
MCLRCKTEGLFDTALNEASDFKWVELYERARTLPKSECVPKVWRTNHARRQMNRQNGFNPSS